MGFSTWLPAVNNGGMIRRLLKIRALILNRLCEGQSIRATAWLSNRVQLITDGRQPNAEAIEGDSCGDVDYKKELAAGEG